MGFLLLCVLDSVIRKFSVVSAARVNWEKSEALAVGEWRGGLPVLPPKKRRPQIFGYLSWKL